MVTKKRATILDVAAEAGVAPSTVSRAFTNPQRVNPRTRDQVIAVAERLGYVPNPSARALGSGRTLTLGLVVPDITNPFFAGVIKGAERAAAGAGRTLILGDSQESAVLERDLIQRLGASVDGLVIAAPRGDDHDLRTAASRTRIALVNRVLKGVPGVIADYESGTRQIVDHLVSLGHRSLVFLGGPPESWSGMARWRGLQAAAEEAGVTARRLGPYAPTAAGGPAAADAAIAAGATAVVCHNDVLAIGVMQRLSARGVRVPDDVSVAGFDDIFGADFCHPALTTLAERTVDAGATAVQMLLQPPIKTPTIALETQLRIRASTGPAAVVR